MVAPVTSGLPVTPLTLGAQLRSAAAGVAVSVQSVGSTPLSCLRRCLTSVSLAGSGSLVAVQTTCVPAAVLIAPSAPEKSPSPDPPRASCSTQSHDPVAASVTWLPDWVVCL